MPDVDPQDFLKHNGWLSKEPDWLIHAMLPLGKIRNYKLGQFTHHVDDDPGGMFGIFEGSFGVMVPSGTAELTLCHIQMPGSWCGFGPVLSNARRSLAFKAMEQSRVLHISLSDLHAIGGRYPEFYRRIGALSEATFLAAAVKVVGDLLIPSSEQRVAAVLVRLAHSSVGEKLPEDWTLRLSQAELGQMSNCSRDRVNRALSKFVKAGSIALDYRSIVIKDFRSLSAFAKN